jgi:hypothetical protein
MEFGHRPEVATPITQPLWIEARSGGVEGGKVVSGYAVAVGWDRPQNTTFYLVSDHSIPRPLWIPEDDVTSNSVRQAEDLEPIERRLQHLEAMMEALQDAMHRESVRQEKRIEQLQRQEDPAAIRRALGRDAREHGL